MKYFAFVALIFGILVANNYLIESVSNGEPAPMSPASPLTLEAPNTCGVGELVRLDASKSKVDHLAWKVIPNTPDFEVVDGSKRGMLSARAPGEYLIVLVGAADGTPYLHIHKLLVDGVAVPPGPKSIGIKISDWYQLVKTEKKAEEARKLAGVFRTLSTTDLEVGKILEATAVANRAALGDSLEGWIPFLDALGTDLDSYIADNQLSSKEQYKILWLQIADGLEKAAS